MAKITNKKLFNNSGCLSTDAIIAYLEKSLDDKDLKKVKNHLENCLLCSDALEGASEIPLHDFIEDTRHLRLRFRKKLAGTKKVQRLRILSYAAVAASVLIITGVFLFYRQILFTEKEKIAQVQPEAEDAEETIGKIELIEPETETAAVKKIEKEKFSDPAPQRVIEEMHDNDVQDEAEIEAAETGVIIEPKIQEIESQAGAAASGTPASPIRLAVQENNIPAEEIFQKPDLKKTASNANYSEVLSGYKKEITDNEEFIFTRVTEMPRFEGGGPGEFAMYIQDTLKRNKTYLQSGFKGNILANFVVDTSGKVIDISLLNINDQVLHKEIVNLFKDSPKWEPGRQKGIKVKVACSVSLNMNH